MKKLKKNFAATISGLLLFLNVGIAQPGQTTFNAINNSKQINNMKKIESKTIVFITGAFVSSSCWDEWRVFFENNGYKTITPRWPNKELSAEALRNTIPAEALASTRLAGLTKYYSDIISQLPEKPILIGHSIGGLITQILLNRGEAAAGIAIHSLAPRGVFTFKLSFYKAGWGPLGFFTSTKRPFLMSFKQWQYAFTNGMTLEQQTEGYYNLVTPESKNLVRDGLSKAAVVDFERAHEPLLLLSGDKDNFIPASLNYSNFKKYSEENSITDYKEFKGRNHFVLGQPDWEEEAEYILSWIQNLSTGPVTQNN